MIHFSNLATPDRAEIQLITTLTCTAYDPDGSIKNYHWDFENDGNIDRVTLNNSIQHTYDNVGYYHATCTVFDNSGNSSTKSKPKLLSVTRDGGD